MRAARRPLPVWADIALLPLVNIALAFITVGIIVRLIGVDPLHALRLLVSGAVGSSESIGYTLYYKTNFIFTGLAVAVAFHGGLFNIGGEGQAYIGGLGCGLAMLAFDRYLPAPILIPVGIIAAAAFGAAWAAVPAWLQAWRGSHIVITLVARGLAVEAGRHLGDHLDVDHCRTVLLHHAAEIGQHHRRGIAGGRHRGRL